MDLGVVIFSAFRVVVRSDPVVRFYEPELLCRLCDGEGHTHLSCHLASSKLGGDMPYEDWVFWTYVAPCDRPEGFEC